jgi:hypothetical protein
MVTGANPLMLLLVAVQVVVPAATALTRPLGLTVNMEVLPEAQLVV